MKTNKIPVLEEVPPGFQEIVMKLSQQLIEQL